MDIIQNYEERKTAGTITLSYVDGVNFTVNIQHFSINDITGNLVEVPPTVETIAIPDLENKVANLQAQINLINNIIADAQALTVS